jgi:hypothetical protein
MAVNAKPETMRQSPQLNCKKTINEAQTKSATIRRSHEAERFA